MCSEALLGTAADAVGRELTFDLIASYRLSKVAGMEDNLVDDVPFEAFALFAGGAWSGATHRYRPGLVWFRREVTMIRE